MLWGQRMDPMPQDHDITAALPALGRLARSLTRDPARAEDLVQETALRVLARLAAGAEVADLAPYLKETLRNLARRPERPTLPLAEAPEPSVLPDAMLRLTLAEVSAALDGLPDDDSRLLRRLAAGEPIEAIARAESIPAGTVMSRAARTRALLRRRCGLDRGDIAALARS